MKSLLLVCVTTLALASAKGGQAGKDLPAQATLWASVAVSDPVFREGNTANLRVSFALVNDGAAALDPRIGSSHLLINGVEPPDWPFLINNGIRSLTHDWLPAGRFLQFAYELSKYFPKPGVYTLEWFGESFRAPKITFRVMPLQAYRPLGKDEMK